MKNRLSTVGWSTPDETYLERSRLSVEQFLAMLRFENRSKLEELPISLE
jgi:hypothetical protein